MELSEKLQADIAAIFRKVQWGEITFKLSPEKKTLDYTVQYTGRLPVEGQAGKPSPALPSRAFCVKGRN